MPFSEVIDRHPGHRRLVGLLARSVDRGTLPPSLIFSGPAGSLTRETAVAVAQALNCLSPRGKGESFDACGACAACVRISRGAHPDVLVVEPGDTGSIKIDPVRDAIDRSGYRPFEGRHRVVIIDEADAMGAPPQNALLKVLEEPPASSVFILVTAQPDTLLPTVQSRCQRLRFQQVEQPADDNEARAVALAVLEHVATNGQLGARLAATKGVLAGTGGGNTATEDREQVSSNLNAIASLLRDIELLSSRSSSMLANPSVRPQLDRLVKTFQGRRGLAAYEAVYEALLAISSNAGVKVVADWLVLKL